MQVGQNLPTLTQSMTNHCLSSDLPAVSQADKDETEDESRYENKKRYLQDHSLDTEYNIRSPVWMQNTILKL